MAFNPMMAAAGAGVGGVVKALMDGQNQYTDQQQKLQQMAAMRPAAPQPPQQMQTQMSAPPPVQPQQMPGAFPMNGTKPVNLDPMTKALFSPIPGAGGQ